MELAQLIPPQPVLAALFSALLMPILLAGFSRGRFATLSPGKQFWLTLATSICVWLAVIIVGYREIDSRQPEVFMFSLLAGAAILVTAGLFLYSVWSLACFGFTTTMLISVAESGSSLPAEQWANAYGGGHGMRAFTIDRISVLQAMKLIRLDGEHVHLRNRRAAWFSKLVKMSFRVFAVRPER
jgi:hypothetical protein